MGTGKTSYLLTKRWFRYSERPATPASSSRSFIWTPSCFTRVLLFWALELLVSLLKACFCKEFSVLWTGNGVFLVEQSREGKMGRNSGIMWAMLQSSLVAGALFLYFVLSSSYVLLTIFMIIHLSDMVSTYRLVYTVFSATSVVGVITLSLLPNTNPDLGKHSIYFFLLLCRIYSSHERHNLDSAARRRWYGWDRVPSRPCSQYSPP